jgi:class 3 adenylate cyclase/pimeloyl-ACP methyl ester carboxylesterase
MEPAVQYVTTRDGVSIAWAEAGQGPTMLFCTFTPFTHVRDQFTVYRDVYDAFTRSFRLITFDARGTGMSERDVSSVSADTLVVDAEAVLDAAKADRFFINVDGTSILATSLALRLAIAFPERVTHLILESAFESTRELADTSFGRTSLALAELDWAVYTETLFRVLLGLSSAALIESYVAYAGTWVDPSVGVQYIREWEAADLSDLLPQVRQPTLVTRNDPTFVPVRSCQRVAAKIPGAKFRQYSDPTYAQIADLIGTFIGLPSSPRLEASAETPRVTTGPTSGTAIILFADIVDSTALTEQLGDTAFRERARQLDDAMRNAIREANGTTIEGKLLGDGVLAVFTSARDAITAALRCRDASASVGLELHLGIHAGDVIRESGNVFGGAVNIAARISAASAPGEILVSDTVRALARTSAGVTFEDRGKHSLKGVAEPHHLFAVTAQP